MRSQVNTQTKRKGVWPSISFQTASIIYFIMWNKPKKLTQMLDPLFHWWLFIYLFNNQLWESSKLLCNRVILFLLQLYYLSFDLCLPAGLNGTRHSTGMLYEKSNEIKKKIMNSGKEGRYEREREYSCALSHWHLLFNDRGCMFSHVPL